MRKFALPANHVHWLLIILLYQRQEYLRLNMTLLVSAGPPGEKVMKPIYNIKA